MPGDLRRTIGPLLPSGAFSAYVLTSRALDTLSMRYECKGRGTSAIENVAASELPLTRRHIRQVGRLHARYDAFPHETRVVPRSQRAHLLTHDLAEVRGECERA